MSREEFEALLGHPVSDGSWGQELELNDPICRFKYAKTGTARRLCRHLEKKLAKKTSPDLTEMFILNLPIRGMAQMTGGKISRAMTEDVVYWANGHFWRGLFRLFKGYLAARNQDRDFRQELDYGPRDTDA